MKSLRQLCAVTVLMLALTGSALAGGMVTGVDPEQPPPQNGAASPDPVSELDIVEPGIEVALGILQSILSIY